MTLLQNTLKMNEGEIMSLGSQNKSNASIKMFEWGLLGAVLFCSSLAAWGQGSLPAGEGKEILETRCTLCHNVERITSRRFAPEDWQDTVNRMIGYGAPVNNDQKAVLVKYLGGNFPSGPLSAGVVIPGNVEVAIKEHTLPTRGTLPHDPMVARDGSVWYSGQLANLIGRFDPTTGQFKEYRMKTPRSGPNGLVEDKDGNIWFAGGYRTFIGKLDPRTGEITEYQLPGEESRPHSITIDPKGTVWFTLNTSAQVGRLIPSTGEVKLVKSPTPNASPYGIALNSKGVPFFTESGTNKLGSIDPETMQITEYAVPNPAARPRRIAITPDDVLWYTDNPRGYLGMYDPKTGMHKEWPSPSGAKSAPYGIAAVGNILWYSESGAKKNTLVRFDPKIEKFQTWLIPAGGEHGDVMRTIVRNMTRTPEGTLWLALSGTNGIASVEVK